MSTPQLLHGRLIECRSGEEVVGITLLNPPEAPVQYLYPNSPFSLRRTTDGPNRFFTTILGFVRICTPSLGVPSKRYVVRASP